MDQYELVYYTMKLYDIVIKRTVIEYKIKIIY